MQRSAFLKSCLALACTAALPAAISPAFAASAAEQLSSGQFTIIAPFPAGGAVGLAVLALAGAGFLYSLAGVGLGLLLTRDVVQAAIIGGVLALISAAISLTPPVTAARMRNLRRKYPKED